MPNKRSTQPTGEDNPTLAGIRRINETLDAAVASGSLPPSASKYGDEHHQMVADALERELPEGCRVYTRKTSNGTRIFVQLPTDWQNGD